MCDYCECRSVDLIKRLGEEHASITAQGSIIRRLALFGDIAEARLRMVDLIAELNDHTEVEETALFPAMRESTMELTAASLVADHRRLDAPIEEADAASAPAWPTLAVALLAVLADHIRREEYDLFPDAVPLLPPPRLDSPLPH